LLRLRVEDEARPFDEALLDDPRDEDACPLDEVRDDEVRPFDEARALLDEDFLALAAEREGVADFRLLVDLLLDFLLEVPEDWLRDFFIDD
jgi:hypothetical protein